MVEGEGHPVLDGEGPEAALDLVAALDIAGVVAAARGVHRGDFHEHRPASHPALLVTAGMEEEAVEPRVNTVGIAQRPEVPPRPDQAFLDGVLGRAIVPEDPPGDRVQPIDRCPGERREGLVIAALCPLDDVPRHPLPRLRPALGRSGSMASAEGDSINPPCTIAPMFERTALPEGPRVISARLPAARSASVAAYVIAGSRNEHPEEAGVAHFLEHLTFKGTKAYPSTRALSEAIEGVGGSFNAATDRESTVYWARVPGREVGRAMDVLGELVSRPALDHGEIARERDVIVEEIRGYLDDPVEYCQILFQQAMFGRSPLGREICGDEADVRGLAEASIRTFWAGAYRPANVVVAVAGDLDHAVAVELAAKAFGTGNGVVHGFSPAPELPAGERILTGRRDTTQAQLCIGVPGLQRDHPDAWALALLNTILGDGMSSRLFLSLVDRAALAYDVGSGIVEYADAGSLEVTAGVDPGKVGKALDAILVELARLRDEPVPDAELAKARAYLAGGLELRMDETRHLASWVGGQEALHDRVLTLDEALAAINAVTVDDIHDLAGRLFRDELLRLAVVAPGRSARGLDRHLRLPG